MKILLMIALCAMLVIPHTSEATQTLITPEEAMNSVRAFEGDTQLASDQISLQSDDTGPTWSHRQWYAITGLSDSQQDRGWRVDAVSGQVTYAFNGDAVPANGTSQATGSLSQADCRQTAQTFAASKYPNFGQMNMSLIREEWAFTGWEFEWREVASYGAITPNNVVVAVNADDGRIQRYQAVIVAMATVREPLITAEQAKTLAKSYTGIDTPDSIKDPTLGVFPDGGPQWGLMVTGTTSDGEYGTFSVRLDAETGNIIEMHMSRDSSAAHSGSKLGGTGERDKSRLEWLRRLVSVLPQATVQWDRKAGATVRVSSIMFRIRPGSNVVQCGHKSLRLQHNSMLMNGRLMVPIEMLDIIKTIAVAKAQPAPINVRP